MDKNYSFARVYPPLNISASLKSVTEDFIVEELVAVEFSGDGEHCWVYIEKREANTDWVAQQLASFCQVKKLAVSYAGLKDRHAVTSQWFSVQLPGKPTPDWSAFETFFSESVGTGSGSNESIRILQSVRHNRKLQRGALKSNKFTITLRNLKRLDNKGENEQSVNEHDLQPQDLQKLEQRCVDIAQQGVPNYFGEQRFGRNLNNLDQAEKVFLKPRYKLAKHKRGLYLSAARSWIFNCILSERIKKDVWNKRLPGDVFMLDGKSACFIDEPTGDANIDIQSRLTAREIHPTAILWGEGDVMVSSQAAELEMDVINQFVTFRDGLVAARIKAQRRACRLTPAGMSCRKQQDDFVVSFSLPAGSYATMVLAEIFSELHEANNNKTG